MESIDYLADFDYTHPLEHFSTNKFNNPAEYLQYERKSWVETQQVQTCYLTKRVVYLVCYVHWMSRLINTDNSETKVWTYKYLIQLH